MKRNIYIFLLSVSIVMAVPVLADANPSVGRGMYDFGTVTSPDWGSSRDYAGIVTGTSGWTRSDAWNSAEARGTGSVPNEGGDCGSDKKGGKM